MSRILPRYSREQLRQEDQRKITRIIGDSDQPDTNHNTHPRATLPGDRRKLRGIPVAGGASGTSPGTDPFQETIRRLTRTTRT